MQSSVWLDTEFNVTGVIEGPICKKKSVFLTRGPFCHGSLQRTAFNTVVAYILTQVQSS